MDDINNFPDPKGDVRIIVTSIRMYRMHSSVLVRLSPKLNALVDEYQRVKLSRKVVKKDKGVRASIQAVHNPLHIPDDRKTTTGLPYLLQAVPVSDAGSHQWQPPVGLNNENGRAADPFVLAYHVVLGALYNYPLDLGKPETDSISEVQETVVDILLVAEHLECVKVVATQIEVVLLSFNQDLYQAIADDPATWLDLGARLESRAIFREAFIHCVGKYNTPRVREHLLTMPPALATLVSRKGKVLQESVKLAFRRVLSYYPQHMQREKGIGRADRDKYGRASYSNDIFSWMAVCNFRHWVVQQVANDHTHHAEDMGYDLIRHMMRDSTAYLTKDQLEQSFHNYFPMSDKGGNKLATKVAEMREDVKKFIKDFYISKSQLDIGRFPVNHFTCVTIAPSEYPWEKVTQQGEYDEDDDLDDDEDEHGEMTQDGSGEEDYE